MEGASHSDQRNASLCTGFGTHEKNIKGSPVILSSPVKFLQQFISGEEQHYLGQYFPWTWVAEKQ
jgi:hypothetical protein